MKDLSKAYAKERMNKRFKVKGSANRDIPCATPTVIAKNAAGMRP